MTEKYDYLRYLFFNNYNSCIRSVVVEKKKIEQNDFKAFNIFRKAAEECLSFKNVPQEKYAEDIVAMWAMVHGLAIMIANNAFN